MTRLHPIPFDTHRFVKRMTEAGMPDAQAEALADEQVALASSEHSAKEDMANLAAKFETLASKESVAELAAKVAELAARIETLATKAEVAELATRIETLATKAEVAELATRIETLASKENVAELATKAEVAELRKEVAVIKAKLSLLIWLVSSIGGSIGGGVVFLVVRAIWAG